MTIGRWLAMITLAVLVIGGGWLLTRGSDERAVRQVMDEVQTAALVGLNRNNPNALDGYFATEAEGAVAAGLQLTQTAYKDFVNALPGSNMVQFHSFDLRAVAMHESGGLARVTYRLHFSVIRNNQRSTVLRSRKTSPCSRRHVAGASWAAMRRNWRM